LQDIICLEEIINSLIDVTKNDEVRIDREVYVQLWDIFIKSLITNSSHEERAVCIAILRVAFNAD
jgi:phosphosulfolactate phosphohydrolase-like enzyme